MRSLKAPYGCDVKVSKLNENAVREIRKLRQAGAELAAIAAQFGVSKPAVWNIVHGRTWRHVA